MRALIKNGYLFTLDPQRRVFERGDVLVDGETIAAIGVGLDEAGKPGERLSADAARQATGVAAERVIDASHCLVLPGMVNACLVPQNALWKGLYTESKIGAVLPAAQDAELTYWLTLLAGIEMLHCGVTTVAHQLSRITQYTPQLIGAAARAYQDLGLRVVMPEALPEYGLPESGRVVVVYNPLSSLHSGEPLLPIHKYQAAGTPLALGSGAFNGGNHNMFDVLKMTFAMQRILQPDYNLWPTVEQVLEMATANGARYCGLANEIGSLEAGKKADLALYDVRGFPFSPLNNPLDQFVCLEDGSSLALLMIDGKVVFEQGQVLTVDENAVKQHVNTLYTQIMLGQPAVVKEG